MHTRPTQKTGKEMPISAPSMTNRSAKVPWRTADITPSGTPGQHLAMIMPLTDRAADHGMLSSTSSNAGWPGDDRGAQVAGKRALDEAQILLPDRAVQPQLRLQRRHRFLGCVVPEHVAGRIAGNGAQQKKHHGDHADHRDAHKQQSSGCVPQHASVPLPIRRPEGLLLQRDRVGLHREQRVLHEALDLAAVRQEELIGVQRKHGNVFHGLAP